MDWLRNASVPLAMMGRAGGGLERADIGIEGGRVASIGPPVPGPGRDLDGGLVLPALVDIHTHLDKGHIWPRRPNPNGTWDGALNAVMTDSTGRWSASDVRRRMEFSLRCAYAHGTAAIRTHLDSVPPQHDISWDLFAEVRDEWRGRIELQAVSLVDAGCVLDKGRFDAVAAKVKEVGGLLGSATAAEPEARAAMFRLVEKAGVPELCSFTLETREHVTPSQIVEDQVLEELHGDRAATSRKAALHDGQQRDDVNPTMVEVALVLGGHDGLLHHLRDL
jgi:cytosine deaminase